MSNQNSKNKKQNNYAFIDSQNLNLAICDLGWKLDWIKFRKYLKDKFDISKAFLFIGKIKKHQNIYDFLKKHNFEVTFKPTIIQDGKPKGNCDAELVLHSAKIEYDNYDKAMIISGDGDFYCLIQFLKENNKLYKIGIPNKKKYSSLLKKFRHPFFLYLSDLKDKLEYKKTKK